MKPDDFDDGATAQPLRPIPVPEPVPAISPEDLAAWRAAMRALPPEPKNLPKGTRKFWKAAD